MPPEIEPGPNLLSLLYEVQITRLDKDIRDCIVNVDIGCVRTNLEFKDLFLFELLTVS